MGERGTRFEEGQFRQLLPEPRTAEIAELLASIDPEPRADRPYLIVNFVASADGRATFDGRSGPLGDDGDRAVFHGLRERVDAVLAGTGTLRAEHYGRILGKPERRERRAARGLPPEPLACIASRSGELPEDVPMLDEPEARVVVFGPAGIDLSGRAAQVDFVALDPGELTLTTVMRRLRADYGVRLLLCEGGPTMFGALLQEELVDELFVTFAPKLTGGGRGPAITSGPELREPRQLEIIWALEREGSVFLRYKLR